MNLYSPDIIKKDYHFNVTTYSLNRHAHEETLSVTYISTDKQKNDTVYFIKKAAIHTDIMEILDYDMPEKESAVVAFQKLKSILPLIGIDFPFDKETCQYYSPALKRIQHCPIYTHCAITQCVPSICKPESLLIQVCYKSPDFYPRKSAVLMLYIRKREFI